MLGQSRNKGIAISYLITVVRALSKILLIPLYLKLLGEADYGFYQYIFSVASYAVILDFGISSVVNTFSIKKREQGDTKGVENVMFYALMFSIFSSVVLLIGGLALIVFAPQIFGATVANRIALTNKMLILITLELIMLMFQHYFEGAILAAEKYVTLRSVALVQIILRCVLTVLLLYSNMGVLSIALGDFIGVGLCLLYEIVFCKVKLKLKIKYHYKDTQLIKSIAKLSSALALQSLVSYLNSSIDKYVLGRSLDTVCVTIYSLAVTFSEFFDEIPTVIQRLYLPQVVKLVASGADGEEMTDFVIKPGRYQFMLVGGVLGGFILFGRQFITIWSGEQTTEAWICALLLMVPSVFPLIQNVCLSILTAMNKRMFRSYVLCGIAIVNLFLTIFLVKKYGLIGAPIGTCISLIVGNNIAMNLYYKYVIHINVKRMFAEILKGILPCAVVATGVCALLLLVNNDSALWLIAECILFCLVYGVLLMGFGMNKTEKESVLGIVKKYLRKTC